MESEFSSLYVGPRGGAACSGESENANLRASWEPARIYDYFERMWPTRNAVKSYPNDVCCPETNTASQEEAG
jgi:hypothetical protein